MVGGNAACCLSVSEDFEAFYGFFSRVRHSLNLALRPEMPVTFRLGIYQSGSWNSYRSTWYGAQVLNPKSKILLNFSLGVRLGVTLLGIIELQLTPRYTI